jgi:hypothetical protein
MRIVTATDEINEIRIFRNRGKMYGSECRTYQRGKIKNIYTEPLKEEY